MGNKRYSLLLEDRITKGSKIVFEQMTNKIDYPSE